MKSLGQRKSSIQVRVLTFVFVVSQQIYVAHEKFHCIKPIIDKVKKQSGAERDAYLYKKFKTNWNFEKGKKITSLKSGVKNDFN